MNSKINLLQSKYSSHLIKRGSSLLLPPRIAPAFVEDLAAINELILGCDGWHFVDKLKDYLVQDLAVELSVDEFIPWNEMTAQKNAIVVQTFIENLPTSIDLISFNLNDPHVKEALSRDATNM
jgi:hypothetical protein